MEHDEDLKGRFPRANPTPREPDRYEAKALTAEQADKLCPHNPCDEVNPHSSPWVGPLCLDCLNAALRVAEMSARSRTAMLAAGMVRGLTTPTRGELSELARQIQDLASPAAAPAAEMGPARYVVPAPRLADAEKRSAELEAALRTVEWMLPPQGESPAYCLSCGGAQPHHAPGCRINAVLSRATPQSGEGK